LTLEKVEDLDFLFVAVEVVNEAVVPLFIVVELYDAVAGVSKLLKQTEILWSHRHHILRVRLIVIIIGDVAHLAIPL